MFLSRLKTATALLLTAGLVAAAAALAQRVTAADETAGASAGRAKPAAAERPAAAHARDTVAYAGRVLAPDGRPVRGAKLYLTPARGPSGRPSRAPESATTGPDGRFRFTVPKAKFGDEATVVTAAAADYGAGWVEVPADARTDALTVRLVADDVPVVGRVVDLEGKPVAGATLRVLQISAAAGEDLGPWLEAVRGKKGRSSALERQYLGRYTTAFTPRATTDAAGRFRLTGLGRNRLVRVRLDGPAIAGQLLHVLTRPGKVIEVTRFEGRAESNDPRVVTTYYGATFRHVAAPTRPVVGVVRDQDTGKPLAEVSVRSLRLANDPLHYMIGQETLRTTTDARGRYRLTGMPKGKGNKIKVVPPDDLPYLAAGADVPDNPGLGPVTVDFALKRGVWITGRITDKVTGKPVKAGVQYIPLYGNPNRRDYPGVYQLFSHPGTVQEDGSYRVVGLPGPGVVAVFGSKDNYLRVDQRQDEFGIKGLSDDEYPNYLRGSNCGALSRINPARGAGSVKRDVTLDPGWKLQGTVLGPDGRPLAGTRTFLLVGHRWDREATRTARFSAWFNPHEASEIVFQHPEKGLVGVVQPPKRNGGSVTVRMVPGAAVTGRLVGADGRPRAGVELQVTFRPKRWGSWFPYCPEPVRTDREGRFRIGLLLPSYDFRLADGAGRLAFGGGLRPGRTKDLGDVRVGPGLGRD